MSDQPATFNGWIASLSNGQTMFEGQTPEGSPSPWQEFLLYLKNNPELRVSQLRLQISGTTIVAIPNKHTPVYLITDGVFHGRRLDANLTTGEETRYRGIGTVIGELVFINWVDDQGTIYQDVRPLDDMIIHTTLRYQDGQR